MDKIDHANPELWTKYGTSLKYRFKEDFTGAIKQKVAYTLLMQHVCYVPGAAHLGTNNKSLWVTRM